MLSTLLLFWITLEDPSKSFLRYCPLVKSVVMGAMQCSSEHKAISV